MGKKKSAKKLLSRKQTEGRVWKNDHWIVNTGRLVPPRGRPSSVKSLFRHVAEKIPYEALDAVRKEFRAKNWTSDGVYIAHDSMGFARYVGRGQVFQRLKVRLKAASLELKYFSFYIVANKNHEREIETLMIRLGGAHLHFNSKKRRVDTQAGNVADYEAGTRFIERQRRRGRPAKKKKK
jgi:hypothetical protein